MPDVRVRMAREPAGGSQEEPQVPVVPWGKGALSRQGQQRPRVKEAGRRQAARPRAERRPARRGPSRPRRHHGVVARQVRPRLSDGRPRQGGGQAGLLPVLFGEEEAREADKARLALGPSARKERGRRRRLLPIGVILRILDWTAMRGGYGGLHRFRCWIYVYVDADAKNRPIGNLPQWDDFLSDSKAAFRSWFIVDDGRNELQKSGGSNSRKQIAQLSSRSISAGNLVFSS